MVESQETGNEMYSFWDKSLWWIREKVKAVKHIHSLWQFSIQKLHHNFHLHMQIISLPASATKEQMYSDQLSTHRP